MTDYLPPDMTPYVSSSLFQWHFDNWQQMIKKTWQTNGCSGNYLKGVALFIKKDKAIVIPTGSVIQSKWGYYSKQHHVGSWMPI